MGHTNSTPNYNLPQFIGTDKPTFLGDINGAFLAIDSAIAGVAADADSAASVANTAASTASGAVETANTAASTAASAASTATAAQSTANTAADTANNAQSTAVLAKSTADSATATATTAAADAAEAKAAAVRGSVEVIADGIKNAGELMNELFALIDNSKVTAHAKFIIHSDTGGDTAHWIYRIKATEYSFTLTRTSGNIETDSFHISANSKYYIGKVTTTPAVTIEDKTSTYVPLNGEKFIIEY